MKDTIRDRPVFAFFGLTMASSWGLWWPIALGSAESAVAELIAVFGPTIAALVPTGYLHGWTGPVRLGRRLRHWRVAPRWHLLGLGLSPALLLVAVGVHRATGRSLQPLSPRTRRYSSSDSSTCWSRASPARNPAGGGSPSRGSSGRIRP